MQSGGCQGLGVGANAEGQLSGNRAFFRGGEEALELDRGGNCATLWMYYYMLVDCYFPMVNFRLTLCYVNLLQLKKKGKRAVPLAYSC